MKKLPIIFLFVLLAVFLFGLTRLFQLRFETGDIYPEYSSLRADPLGAKALYESLDNLLDVHRNYRPFSKLGEGTGTTLFYLGSQASYMVDARSDLRLPSEDWDHLEDFVRGGGRLVISLFPIFQKPSTNRFRPTPAPAPGKGKRPSVTPKRGPGGNDEDLEDIRTVSIRDRWGLQYNYDELAKDENHVYKPVLVAKVEPAPELPERLACHTALFFDNLTNSWRVIYARKQGRAVMIERDFGAGAIVLAADSFPLSNEALWKERAPGLLTWLVGHSQHVVFDETHFGVEESSGVTALARKYRLHGLLIGLLLLAGLFVWKNATHFVPPCASDTSPGQQELLTGKDSAAGFVNLLRRNLPSRELLAICLAEWKKSCGREQPRAKLEQMQTIIDAENAKPPNERDPVHTYRALSRILSRSAGLEPPESPTSIPKP